MHTVFGAYVTGWGSTLKTCNPILRSRVKSSLISVANQVYAMINNSQGTDVHKDNMRKSEPEEQGEGMSQTLYYK